MGKESRKTEEKSHFVGKGFLFRERDFLPTNIPPPSFNLPPWNEDLDVRWKGLDLEENVDEKERISKKKAKDSEESEIIREFLDGYSVDPYTSWA